MSASKMLACYAVSALRTLRPSMSLTPAAVSAPLIRTLASSSSARLPSSQKPGPASDPYPLPLQTSPDVSPQDALATEPHPQDRPRRNDEDLQTLRARLVYQTRKRGTLETGLLLSTFATVDRINSMPREELEELDRLMSIPEWTLYYWSVGKQQPGEDSEFRQSKLLDALREHSKNKEGVYRSMPELPS